MAERCRFETNHKSPVSEKAVACCSVSGFGDNALTVVIRTDSEEPASLRDHGW